MSRAVKSAAIIKAEGKAHKTRSELAAREKAEKAMLSGAALTEDELTRKNPEAHKKFLALKKLLQKIEKNDGLYSDAVNQYCQLYAEILAAKRDEEKYRLLADKLSGRFDELENAEADDIIRFTREFKGYIKEISSVGAGIMQRRKMMTDLGKEFGLTAAAALRIIPKTAEPSEDDALIKALREGQE